MKKYLFTLLVVPLFFSFGCKDAPRKVPFPGLPKIFIKANALERHFSTIQQLSFGGENAEAYFSSDGKELIFQSNMGILACDQIYIMPSDGSRSPTLVSTEKGRTTCSYFFPGSEKILYSSTHATDAKCPPKPSFENGYVWALYPSYEIYTANRDGTDLKQITNSVGYDAEATISTDGSKIVFTSLRDGDVDLYTMNPDGSDVKRLTTELGYEGGAYFSSDGTKIVYRANHPKTDTEIADYKKLLNEGLIRPTTLEIFVMDADGSNKKQVTFNGAANFAPFFHPSGKKIIFSSNVNDPKGRNFDLFLINIDGTGLEQITFEETFDSFPMFSPDGKKLVWASNRNGQKQGDTNIFMADWAE